MFKFSKNDCKHRYISKTIISTNLPWYEVQGKVWKSYLTFIQQAKTVQELNLWKENYNNKMIIELLGQQSKEEYDTWKADFNVPEALQLPCFQCDCYYD